MVSTHLVEAFTVCSWPLRSPDGQCLILSARDGYCTLVIFDEIIPAHHTQQHTLQMQSIAQHHSVQLTTSGAVPTPLSTPSVSTTGLPAALSQIPVQTPAQTPAHTPSVPTKRPEPPLTPAASVDENAATAAETGGVPTAGGSGAEAPAGEKAQEPPKKKRRVALTRVGDVGS